MSENATPILSPAIADKWAKLRMAHEAMMLDDAMELLGDERAATRQHRATMLTDGEGNPPAEDGGDVGRGVHIGDMIYHCVPPPAAQPLPTSPSAAASAAPAQRSATQAPAIEDSTAGRLSPWIKSAAVIAASALGGGAAVPIGSAIVDWWNSSPPAASQPAPAQPRPGLEHGGVTIEPFKVQ